MANTPFTVDCFNPPFGSAALAVARFPLRRLHYSMGSPICQPPFANFFGVVFLSALWYNTRAADTLCIGSVGILHAANLGSVQDVFISVFAQTESLSLTTF